MLRVSGTAMRCPSCHSESDPDATVCFSCGWTLAPPIQRGSLIGGRYEVRDPIGRGGLGTVYRARDRVLGDRVAVKVLRSEVSRRPEMVRRFREEMGVARRVRHPHLCAIYAFGEQDGRLWLCMELIRGTDLRTLLRERGLALPPETAFTWSLQVAEGLHALHEAGIVHRDVKAGNVMIDHRGAARLMDFDIAKQREGEDASAATGDLLGTPEYMSPEYARGEPVDARTDVYSLGVLIYEMFTGEVPFRGETPLATILKHLHEAPALEGPHAAALPPTLVPVLRKALAKRREQRYSTAQGVGVAVSLARAAMGELAPPPAPPRPPLPALLEALNPVDRTVRLDAIVSPESDTAARRAIPVLIDALAKSPESVLLPTPPLPVSEEKDPIAVLVRALRSEDQDDRARAARLLGGIGPDAARAIPVLLEALRDHIPRVRDDAARALERIGPAAHSALASALDDEDPVVRRIAAEALGRILRRKKGRGEG